VRRAAVISLVLVVVALSAVGPATAQSDPNAWTSYGFDDQLSNSIASDALTLRTVSKLRLGWSQHLDGPVYASPLAANVGSNELVFAATEAGSVYAVDTATGAVVWQRDLGTVTTGECGTWGVTSTGAISRRQQLLYVIGATGELHALDLGTGADAAGYPRRLIDDPAYEYVWGGLRIAAGRLYVPVASYCDVGAPNGFFPEGGLITMPLDQPGQTFEWDAVPGAQNLGGIWGWGGVSVDPDTGAIFTAIGNSHAWSDECQCYVDNEGYGDQVVALKPDLSQVLDANEPGIPATGDSDFGAAPLLFQPDACPPLAAANNKDGALYVWDRTRLAAGPLLRLPLGDGIAPFVGSPGWSRTKQVVYVAQSVIRSDGRRLGNGVTAWHVDAGCGFRPIWQASLGDGNQPTPLLAGNVLFATGGTPGGFFALNAANGKVLWTYATGGRTTSSMISVAGEVFGADTDGVLYAFAPPARIGRACTIECFRRFRRGT
jgi:hypothetical protein